MAFLDNLRRRIASSIMPGKPVGKRLSDMSGTYGNGGQGGFAGGAVGRLTASLATWSGAVNYDLDGSLTILRARGRQMAQNNEHGRRFLTLVANNIVGPRGPMLQVRATMANPDPKGAPMLDKVANDAIEVHYARWAARAEITGKMDLAHAFRVAAKSVARDGEALVRLVRRKDLPYGIALQLLEADRLDDQLNTTASTGNIIRQGVELDATGRPVALHLKTVHPGDRYTVARTAYERVPTQDIIHLFLPERAEQVRGYSWFHAIILRAMQLHGFNDAAVTAARVGASKVAAIQERAGEPPPPGALEQMADSQVGGALQMNVEAGEMFQLPPGYELASWNPEYPHANFDSFVKTAMRGISMGLDVATHNLGGDMTEVNFSSARIAELSERDVWVGLQAWFIRSLVQPVFEEWLAIALLRGDITFPQSGKALPADKLGKFRDAARFQGRRWRWVNPAQEMTAAREGVALGITSRSRLAAEQGDDFDDILDELRQERQQLVDAGLWVEPEDRIRQLLVDAGLWVEPAAAAPAADPAGTPAATPA